jgi:protein TonB
MADPYLKSPAGTSAPSPDAEHRQRNRMLLAVFLLLFAVGIVLLRDWGTLFSSNDEPVVSEAADNAPPTDESPAATAGPAEPSIPSPSAPTPASVLRKPHLRGATPGPARKALPAPVPENGIVVTSRAVLPPLHVEVVAGNRKTTVHPGSSSMRVDIDPPPPASAPDAPPASPSVEVPSAGPAPLTNASDRMHMSTDAELELEHAAQPEYPMLARQMKVQGSVTLEALIGRDGGIQQLQVLQGPAILADAARQAVRQWRFKPYLQDGQAVETQAHITVNFTISTN